jgi:hypothetical protein
MPNDGIVEMKREKYRPSETSRTGEIDLNYNLAQRF